MKPRMQAGVQVERPLSKAEVIALERDLAKWASLMDSLIRIPFTRQGMGLDAMIGMVPVVGDLAGLFLTLYIWQKAKRLGLPQPQLNRILQLAVLDALLGVVPILGTVLDILIQPSRQAAQMVHQHIHQQYQLEDDQHVRHPYLHERLQQKQLNSVFWRHPAIIWLWLHSLDLLGVMLIGVLLAGGGWLTVYIWHLLSS